MTELSHQLLYKHQRYRTYCLSRNWFLLFLSQVLFPKCRLLSRLSRIHLRLKICYPSDNFLRLLLVIVIFPSRYHLYLLLYKHQRYRTYCL
ncbi:hypothetical protein OMAG_002806 [Candidatus Omnitrophus magneticus]|uniref:Uncharacterized protein n=1 Tax=Candidatus Omnitrophus magneticus TaxID=1609969 RepID=A0A0F0CJD7_9BACT|nr:hypothetical protein OMAG_002806 [Candidatus Omnitrophus magneticus]